MKHLIQPRELYGPPERREEFTRCWNINDTLFDKVTELIGRPTFAQMFAMCLPDHLNVIANSDIHFDDTLPTKIPEGHIYALSRYDKRGDTLVPWHGRDSQDAWMVQGGPWHIQADFTMGIPGCDNVIAHVLSKDFRLSNPCMSIRAIHLHESGYRTYGEGRGKPKMFRLQPPYHFVYPCSL